MAVVYVISASGKPLMPTTRCGHVRGLLNEGKARVVEREPFTIQLKYETPDVTQPLYLGIDPGRTNVGAAVVCEDGECVFTAQLTTRNKDVPKLPPEAPLQAAAQGEGRRDALSEGRVPAPASRIREADSL